jgi:hypothetical protein
MVPVGEVEDAARLQDLREDLRDIRAPDHAPTCRASPNAHVQSVGHGRDHLPQVARSSRSGHEGESDDGRPDPVTLAPPRDQVLGLELAPTIGIHGVPSGRFVEILPSARPVHRHAAHEEERSRDSPGALEGGEQPPRALGVHDSEPLGLVTRARLEMGQPRHVIDVTEELVSQIDLVGPKVGDDRPVPRNRPAAQEGDVVAQLDETTDDPTAEEARTPGDEARSHARILAEKRGHIERIQNREPTAGVKRVPPHHPSPAKQGRLGVRSPPFGLWPEKARGLFSSVAHSK